MTDSSSLTFLKGSSDGTVGSSDGTVSSSHGTVGSSHATSAGGGDAEPSKKTRKPSDDDDNRLPLLVETGGDAEKAASLETLRQRQAGMGQEQGTGDESGRRNGNLGGAGEGGGEV